MIGDIPDLEFRNGWLQSPGPNSGFKHWVHVSDVTSRKWSGMHPVIKKDFNNKLQGTITHYDALGSGSRTVNGMCGTTKPGPSTHFIIDRNGDIYQIASLIDRTWHAGFHTGEWPENNGKFMMANGHLASNPNHWFVGIDMSNWGFVNAIPHSSTYKTWAGVTLGQDKVLHTKGKHWEVYTPEALTSYKGLQVALTKALGIEKRMHYRHSDTSPTRKVDPGDAFPFHQLIDSVYEEIKLEEEWHKTWWDLGTEDKDIA